MDPNLDPELALALRVSMEEERARQETAAKRAAEAASASATTVTATPQDATQEKIERDTLMAEVLSGIPVAGNAPVDYMVCTAHNFSYN